MSLTMYSLSREAQILIVRRDEWCHEGVLTEKDRSTKESDVPQTEYWPS